MKFNICEGNPSELLNQTDEPIRLLKIYNFKGKLLKIKPRCELCAFAKINLDMLLSVDDDYLLCSKTKENVNDEHICDSFNITRAVIQDIYHGCIKWPLASGI